MIRPQTCPICEQKLPLNASSELDSFPFCSKRCRDIDFCRWSDGRYAIVEPLDPAKHDLESLLDGEDLEDLDL